jgi:acetolactate synthase I/II/III large subunit
MKKIASSAQAIVDSLIRHGVRRIFGIPGVHTYALFDALYERRAEIEFIGTRHEQGAAYMAYGYAKSTGNIGVYTCVPGPGVLNTAAALCTAYAANAAVLCLTSEIPSQEIGRGHGILHELPDQLGLLRGLTKWAERINHPSEAPLVMARAMSHLTSGRIRPVAIECPWDILGARSLLDLDVDANPDPAPLADPRAVASAVQLIAGALNPMIMVGSGALGAVAEINELAQLLQSPVMAHRSGRGIVAEDSPRGFNLADAYEPWLQCDVLIAIGTRMELQYVRWRKFPAGLKLVRIDIDPLEMVRRKADVGIVADAAAGARALIDALKPLIGVRPSRTEQFAAIKARSRIKIQQVQPQVAYLEVIREALPRDGFFVEEICQVGFTARFGFPVFNPRTYVASGYQENLGFGFMTALGVKAAHPRVPVISINGDGGFMFGVQELATAVQHKINVIAIVFNNRSFGNVLRDQTQTFGGRLLGQSLQNPDFVDLARAFGAAAYRADTPPDLRRCLAAAMAEERPVVIEVPGEPGAEQSPWAILHPEP